MKWCGGQYNPRVGEIRFPRSVESDIPSELELSFGSFTLRGTSVAARATAFAVPELELALDLGRLSPVIAAQPRVLLTHAHLDHLSAVLAYLNLRARFYRGQPPTLLAPESVAGPLQQALAVMPGMDSVRKRLDLDGAIRTVSPGETVALGGLSLAAFAQQHSVPTLGWSIAGEQWSRPLLVYAGDGPVATFAERPELLDAEVAVAECTFLERNRRVAARISTHAHILDWVELGPQIRCDVLVLIHLPQIPPSEVRRLVEPLEQATTATVVPWVMPPRSS